MDRASFLLSLLGKADRVDGRPNDSNGIEEFVDFYVQCELHLLERVVKNRPGLPWHTLRLEALGHRPLVTGSVDADGVSRKAVEVRDSSRVGLGQDVFWDVLGKIEVTRSDGSGRDKGNNGREGKAVALLLSSHRNTRCKEFALVIHWNERAKMKR